MSEKDQLMDELTQLRKRIAELERNDHLFKETEESGKIGGWQFDPLTLKQTWSEEIFRILEIDLEHGAPEVPKGLEFIDPEFRPMAEKVVQQAMANGEPYNQEWLVTTAKGNKKWVNAVCNPKMENGKVVEISGSFQDITSKKIAEEDLKALNQQLAANEQQLKAANQQLQASEQQLKAANQQLIASEQQLIAANQQLIANEQQLRAANQQLLEAKERAENSEKYLENIIENIADPIFVKDEDSKLLVVNEAFCKLFGLNKGNIIGKNLAEDVTPAERESFLRIDKMVLNNGKENINEESLTVRGGITKTISTKKSRFFDEKGRKFLVGVISDITECKQSEIELLKAKELSERNEIELKRAQEITHIGNWNLDLATNEVKWSKELYEMYGFDSNLPVPPYTEHMKLFTPESWELLSNALAKTSEKGIPYELELRTIRKNNSNGWMWVRGEAVYDQNNNITSLWGAAQDISERKNVEIELKKAKEKAEENEQKYKTLYNFAPIPYQSLNEDGIIIDINPAWLELLGYQENEVIGKWYGDFVHPDIVSNFIQNFPVLKSCGAVGNVPFQLRRKDGTYIYISLDGNSAYNPDGSFRQTYCVFKDTTAQKLAENELVKAKEKAEESELQFKQLFDSEGDAVFIADEENGIILDVNRAGEKLMQMKKNEIIGLHQSKLHPQNSDEFSTKSFTEHKQSIEKMEDAVLIENKIVRKNGVEVPVEILASKVRYKGTECLIGTFRDITERKKAEEALRKSEEMIISSQSVANICSYSTTLNENELEKSTWICSPEFYNIFGIDETYPHTIAGWVGFIHPDYRDKLAAYHEYVVKNKTSFHHQYKIIRINDGVERWVEGTGELEFDTQGNPIRMYGAIQDITERKKVEKDLIEAKLKAEESDRLKSAFLANMSHEIRTPMNGILGFSSLLKEPGLTGDQQQNYIEIIEQSGARMLSTINDIVDISKIEAGLMDVSISEVSVNEVIECLYQFFKAETDKKEIQLSIRNGLPYEESFIKTDGGKLDSILTNLVKNAIKYSKSENIEFGYELVEAQCIASLQFYVKDTGIGIPKDRQQAIFDRFVQVDIENKQALQGSGLGLAISKAYVEMLGGKIWVESEPGQGSAFYFNIPYQVEQIVNDDVKIDFADVKDENQIRKLNIVIAEDDPTSVTLLEIMLQPIAKNIRITSNGVETIEVCRKNPDIDLVLMDIQMPGMNGYDATRRIREFNTEVIIIALTAFALAGDREKAINAGCNDYISKPIKKDDLLEKIQKYFKKKQSKLN